MMKDSKKREGKHAVIYRRNQEAKEKARRERWDREDKIRRGELKNYWEDDYERENRLFHEAREEFTKEQDERVRTLSKHVLEGTGVIPCGRKHMLGIDRRWRDDSIEFRFQCPGCHRTGSDAPSIFFLHIDEVAKLVGILNEELATLQDQQEKKKRDNGGE